ncbi:MAG: DUF2207 domain-containing protein [bacterium]|nr:DUF2207 domain-containing protein [bacterium]
MKRIFLFAIILLALSAKTSGQESNEEKITSFISDVIVKEDGVLEVTENIRVYAAGDNIIRGIYRDFPIAYKDRFNSNVKVDFNLLSVTKNGFDENFRIDKRKNYVRIYIGESDALLEPGYYIYTLKYETKRQIGFYKDHDELYWNVNGNYWIFPAETIECNVFLPSGAFKGNVMYDGFTGYFGSDGKEFSAVIDTSRGRITFKTTRRFESNEGLTVVVGIEKGIIEEPTQKEKLEYFLEDNKDFLFAFAGLLVLFLFFYVSWLKVGKDPEKGTIIPLFQPTDNLSPAEMRYIMRMGNYDSKTTSCALLNIAVKGHMTIEDKNKIYILKKNHSEKTKQKSSDEEILFSNLFSLVSELILTNSNHEIIGGSVKEHSKHLKEKFSEKYFFNNTKYFAAGIAISLIIIIATFFISDKMNPIALFMYAWLSIWSVGVFALLAVGNALWKESVKDKKQLSSAFFMTLFSIPFVAGEIFGISVLISNSSMLINAAFFGMIALDILFYKWLKAPSVEGRNAMNRIEGFKMYLRSAEKNELEISSRRAPDEKEYEKYLPYAVALDVEDGWTKSFTANAGYADYSGERGYRPSWYSGSFAGAAYFSSAFSSSFGSAVNASSISPKRSSSSGFGGGSSGGGGGGGGGGGW